MKEPFSSSLKIDWLSLRFHLKGEDAAQAIPVLVGYAADPESGGAYGIVRGGSKLGSGSLVALQFFAPKSQSPLIWGDKPVASLRAKKAKGGGVMLYVYIHPPGLTPPGASYVVDQVLCMILNRAPWEIAEAKVTRIDIALDLFGVRLEDVAWGVRGKRIRRPFVNAPTLKSLGFGSPKHGAVAIYDRTGKDGHDANQPWTRIEGRLKPACAVKHLPSTKNLFARLDVVDVRSAWKDLGRHPIEAEAMLALAQLKGWKAVVDLFPKDTPVPFGKTVAKALQTATPTWWNPDLAWDAFPDALALALPAKSNVVEEGHLF
ncbi:hypothetical protein AAFN86_00925 [Roseomonas sp. CAU 1739]|uniref:hypothetical protein n=1 Tax=Roseomonas sp. CAU 1739 TaxID=3140364 RepID=UPI00325B4B59